MMKRRSTLKFKINVYNDLLRPVGAFLRADCARVVGREFWHPAGLSLLSAASYAQPQSPPDIKLVGWGDDRNPNLHALQKMSSSA